MGSCRNRLPFEIFRQARKSIDPKPDLNSAFLYVDALDQQLNDTRLLGREELVPQRVQLSERVTHLSLRDRVVLAPRRPPSANDDFWSAKDGAELIDDGSFDVASGEGFEPPTPRFVVCGSGSEATDGLGSACSRRSCGKLSSIF